MVCLDIHTSQITAIEEEQVIREKVEATAAGESPE